MKKTLGDLTGRLLDGHRLTRVYWILLSCGEPQPCAITRADTKELVLCPSRAVAEEVVAKLKRGGAICAELAIVEPDGTAHVISSPVFGACDRDGLSRREGCRLLSMDDFRRLVSSCDAPFCC